MLDRGEIYNPNKRVSKRKDNKLLSLDDANATPNIDPSQLRSPHERSPYTQKRLRIARPRYAANGQLLDPGDSTIPGMTDLWASIDHLDKWLSICYGHLPPEPHFPLITDSYRIYKMHTLLIELRQTQYFLKDSWNPPIHFTKVDHPKPAFIDWNADSFYWIDENDWTQRIKNALTHTISQDRADYEEKIDDYSGKTLIKWVVRRHEFDWENPKHVRALLDNYDRLDQYLREKLDTVGNTLLFDLERYVSMCDFDPIRLFLIEMKKQHTPYTLILRLLERNFNLSYNTNHLSYILASEIPKAIALAAGRHRVDCETPMSDRKQCFRCHRMLPKHSYFYTRNVSRKDGWCSICKECEKKDRVKRGEQTTYDKRIKAAALYEMQTGKA